MGQKQNKKLHRTDTHTSNSRNIFSDAVDLEEEAEELKLGNKKSMNCPICHALFNTSNKNEIETWMKHKKSCKAKNTNRHNKTNSFNNTQTFTSNRIPPLQPRVEPPPPRIVQPPPRIVPPPPRIVQPPQIVVPPPPMIVQHPPRIVPPPMIQRPPPINTNYTYNNNYNNNNYYNNNYNSNLIINPYRPQSVRHNNPPPPQNQQSDLNVPTVIRVNPNNQELNNILEAIGLETKKVLPRGKKDGTFEEKVDYLRFDISKKKIDFINGAEKLKINRDRVLEDSQEQFLNINLFKELKIIFVGEESHDAGGLIREWLTILFQKILDPNTGLFVRSDTGEIGYIIKPNLYPSQELLNKYYFIGRVLAKALLENLTVNCCFNKLIYQLILGEKIVLNDLVFIDKPLYNSMKHLVSMKEECADNIALCEIYFTFDYEDENGRFHQEDLIENGRNVLVTQYNLDQYIDKRIEYYTKSQISGIKEIIRGINTIFPVDYLKIFTSDQLGLLINGTPFIDVDDWRINTKYKDYQDYDNVIVNFWDIITNLSQEDLSNFLLFCTGSSRVPIGGFKSLESNRGQISKFEIVKTEYYEGKKNFLRAHTCFNRLDLPNFPDKEKLNEAIKFALENEVLGFGIE